MARLSRVRRLSGSDPDLPRLQGHDTPDREEKAVTVSA